MCTAEPRAQVFNDTFYVYPSHDQVIATCFSMKDWHVFSTTDMVNWKDHGVALSLDSIHWAKINGLGTRLYSPEWGVLFLTPG